MKQPDDNLDMFDSVDASPADVLANMGEAEIASKWPAETVNFIEAIQSRYVRQGTDLADARKLAIEAVLALAEYAGGRVIYLPKADGINRLIRNKKIWEEFNGSNIDQLSQRYKLTVAQVYAIIREQRTLHSRKIQPGLFQ